MMQNKIAVVQVGLGPIGREAARIAHEKKSLRIVGGIDIDKDMIGKDLGEILGINEPLNLMVTNNIAKILEETRPDVILHSTGSFISSVEEQLRVCLQAGASVVSSCEELFYPYRRNAEFCARIDRLAREHNATVLGTGINPGFSLDFFVLSASSVCTHIESVRATRVSNAARRRLPLQKKVGAGLTVDEFRTLVEQGKLGHIGLIESLHAVLDKTGLQVDEIQETIDPKIAEKDIVTPHLQVRRHKVAGIVHVARAMKDGKERVRLELQMYIGAENESDTVVIDGQPPIHVRVDGGIFGDKATIARMVNAIPVVFQAESGLKTVMDLPLTCYFE